MENVYLFPIANYWWLYVGFTLLVLLLLGLDLSVFHREAHEVTFKESATWSVIWVSLALVFNLSLYTYCSWRFAQDPRLLAIPGFDPEAAARNAALEFLTGYVVEKSLAVDNIFVFVLVFSFFAIPAKYQHRVLFFGILGALGFRVIFIALGAILMQYEWVVVIFGLFLIFTGIKILFSGEKPLEPERNPLIKLLRRFMRVTPQLEDQHFFVRKKGYLYVTPLFISLICIEISDIIFAVDSVPAIFAITKEPLIVFSSNVFAIPGLRAMYFMLAGVVHRFTYLKYGLALVLVFVGLKMVWLNEAFGGKFPITWSLTIIAGIIGTSIALSLLLAPKPGPNLDTRGRAMVSGDQRKALERNEVQKHY